jgi:hypothetical protein
MRWPWRQRRAIEPRSMVSRAMELEAAKEILAEVFGARPGEVEQRGWREEREGRAGSATFFRESGPSCGII